jgi:hypothetical protein
MSHSPQFRAIGTFLRELSRPQPTSDPFYFMLYSIYATSYAFVIHYLYMFICININTLICSYTFYVLNLVFKYYKLCFMVKNFNLRSCQNELSL